MKSLMVFFIPTSKINMLRQRPHLEDPGVDLGGRRIIKKKKWDVVNRVDSSASE
jgi:hypothetical protein